MSLHSARLITQHLSFLILLYGGRLGLDLGRALPCFACPYVSGCGGHCYLMGLQGYLGLNLALTAVNFQAVAAALIWLGVFILLVAALGKLWCGWVCPFGLVQDWLSALRRRLNIRASHFSAKLQSRINPIKYILLIYLLFAPLLVAAELLPPDFYLPFCGICPGKALLPLFIGNTQYLSLNLDNSVSLGFSIALIIVTGLSLAGSFFKARFFCHFCPLLALIQLLKPLTIFKLSKNPSQCPGCGSCRRHCPMDINRVFMEKTKADVQSGPCLNCGDCVAHCPSDGALSLKWLRPLYVSARRRAAQAGKNHE